MDDKVKDLINDPEATISNETTSSVPHKRALSVRMLGIIGDLCTEDDSDIVWFQLPIESGYIGPYRKHSWWGREGLDEDKIQPMEYPCARFGERWKDFPECLDCPDEICMACSTETLKAVLGGTMKGNVLIVANGETDVIEGGGE